MVSPMELASIAGIAILLFGAERLPKIARSAGEMRREFLRGQTESEGSLVTPASTDAKEHEPHST
jgi:TatA/E family protein of Tat protein translocase